MANRGKSVQFLCQPVQFANCQSVLSVALTTLFHMTIDRLERRASVAPDVVDDVTVLAELASLEPGVFPMMLLEGIDPTELDFDARLDYARAWDRQQRWATAQAQNALASLLMADLPDDDDALRLEMSQRIDVTAVDHAMASGDILRSFEPGAANRH